MQGILVVDKPRGPTSHDIVHAARRQLKMRRVGHAGTLDPMASGVLLLLLGEATKLSGYLTLDAKRYRARVELGAATDTLDALGDVTSRVELSPGWLERAAVDAALRSERARQLQIPPAFSAISVGGQRAHRLSRRGAPPVLEPRPVAVHQLDLLEVGPSSLTLELHVSKGYYVRSLARDIGEHLGVPAHLGELRRLSSGPFTLEEAVGWPLPSEVAPLSLLTVARRCLPCGRLTEEGSRRARLGQRLGEEHFAELPNGTGQPESVAAWIGADDTLLALGQRRNENEYRVVRGFRDDSDGGTQ